jgi:serine/threonine protein kinase
VETDFAYDLETLKKGRATWDERGAFRGTIAYCAPEVLRGDAFDEKSDVYGYALVLWALYTCEEPWNDVFTTGDNAEFTRRVLFENMRPNLPEEMPPRLSKLIQRCWDAESTKRPAFNEIVEELDLVMLDVSLGTENSLARAFWEHHFGSRYQVDFDEFMGYASRLIPMRTETEEAVVKYLFTYGGINFSAPTVTLERYGRMMRWFGPVTKASSDVVTKRMVGATQNRWFHGFINMSLAVSLLAEQPPGTFLVRFCNSRKKGHFFIIYSHAPNDIRFLRVVRLPAAAQSSPSFDTRYIIEGSDRFPPASSLAELISRLEMGEGVAAGLPQLLRPATGWPFAQIFLHIESPNLRGASTKALPFHANSATNIREDGQ